jgi:hypothetical protein
MARRVTQTEQERHGATEDHDAKGQVPQRLIGSSEVALGQDSRPEQDSDADRPGGPIPAPGHDRQGNLSLPEGDDDLGQVGVPSQAPPWPSR